MWAMAIENYLRPICVEDSWVEPTAFGPVTVDSASLTVVEDASPQRILELAHPISLDDKKTLKAKIFYSCYVFAV